MPAVRTYIVTQEREVKVTGESPADAVAIADRIFESTDSSELVHTHVRSEVKTVATSAREEF